MKKMSIRRKKEVLALLSKFDTESEFKINHKVFV